MSSTGPWTWKICHGRHVALRDLIGLRNEGDSDFRGYHVTFTYVSYIPRVRIKSELELRAIVGWNFGHGTETNFAILYVGSQSPLQKLSIE